MEGQESSAACGVRDGESTSKFHVPSFNWSRQKLGGDKSLNKWALRKRVLGECRLPPNQYEEVKAHIKKLLEQKVMCESCSPYASPVVVVQKKDRTIRMCVDYRHLNAKTRKDTYPLPWIDESLDALGRAQCFTTIDLASGYNQVAVAETKQRWLFVLHLAYTSGIVCHLASQIAQ
ncbi:hypothetical protein P4O66_015568 [Electrophorus voltai]|uniref:Reverse transcriptase domain-containing protein n=1 Tax=Electrophorus voltai TaxID=2609070 RepID=A0AAD8YYH0_9TELE|nr:hypothetical protein P4O66_015568 [Electrophorus voltai]